MTNEEMIEHLTSLSKADYDAMRSYERVTGEIDEVTIREHLQKFREEHQRHFDVMSELIQKAGGERPEPSPDIRGYFMEVMSLLRSQTGTKGALRASENVEKHMVERYEEAVRMDFPSDVRTVLEKHLSDIESHLTYVQNELAGMEARK